MKTIAAAIMFLATLALPVQAQSKSVQDTINKAKWYKTQFMNWGWPWASIYLDRWLARTGGTAYTPTYIYENRSDYQSKTWSHRAIIESAIRSGVNWRFLPGRGVYHLEWTDSLSRPWDWSDFMLAVGGCTIHTDADFYLSPVNLNSGAVVVTFVNWRVTLTDSYHYDASDSYFGFFGYGEMKAVEDAGYAKPFNLNSAKSFTGSGVGAPIVVFVPLIKKR